MVGPDRRLWGRLWTSWATLLTDEIWNLNGDGMTESSLGWDDNVETVSASVPNDGQNTFIGVKVSSRAVFMCNETRSHAMMSPEASVALHL